MIKDFWQERKAEKKRLKELKKQNKKLPKTKEQKAYKIFGVILGISVTIGALAYSCSSTTGNGNDVNWNSVVGITGELATKLEEPVELSSLISDSQLEDIDWSNCMQVLSNAGINIFTNNKIDIDKLNSARITENFDLTDREIGAFTKEYIEGDTSIIDIYELDISVSNNKVFMRSLTKVDLTTLSGLSDLPNVYFVNTSELRVLDGNLTALNSNMKVNALSDEDCESLLKAIDVSGMLNIKSYVNDIVNLSLNTFKQIIGAEIKIIEDKILFYKES